GDGDAGEEPIRLVLGAAAPPGPRHTAAEPGAEPRGPRQERPAAEAEAPEPRPTRADADHGASAIRVDGIGEIEIITVKPESHGGNDAEDARKAAALARVLARRKDQPYAVPVDGILQAYPDGEYWIVDEKTKRSAEVLRDTLAEFNIEAEVTGIRKGPVITMFEILPAPGVKLSKITNLSDNIALRLAASSVRIVAPIPGKHAVGIEVPNERRSIVSLREIVENTAFTGAKMEVPIILGKDIAGEVQFIDLVQTPHLLIAGATGSGKSVCVNSIILSILYRRSPREVKLLLIDPKIVELKLYNDIPHLLTPVITEPKRAFQALQYCICEMERRYSMLDRVGVRDVKSYNRKVKEKNLAVERLPYIVVIIDEFADLMATTGKELESTLARLAAMSRAVGIHLVLATQRPSIDVITGLIKANIPSRIAFMVASKFDSRIIIDMVGAEKLLGRGDMLVASAWDPFPIRMQGAFVSEEEVEKAVDYIRTLGEPEYIDDEIFIDEDEEDEPSLFGEEDDDPLFEKALEIVLQQGKASASYIQRRLKIGYNRASRLVELMEEKGIVGPAKGSKPRDLVRNPEVLGKPMSPPAARQPSLMPDLETLPGQRVTGRDEPADEDPED
ncbi:MAG TPA: DNA translocase FtsK, partial [Rectinemataceae bacterium]|nr:DNA translocase FtsK [Rectinemataceae bacterium]